MPSDPTTTLTVTWAPTITVKRGDGEAKSVDSGLQKISSKIRLDLTLSGQGADLPLLARFEAQGLLDDVARLLKAEYTDQFEDAVLEAFGIGQ